MFDPWKTCCDEIFFVLISLFWNMKFISPSVSCSSYSSAVVGVAGTHRFGDWYNGGLNWAWLLSAVPRYTVAYCLLHTVYRRPKVWCVFPGSIETTTIAALYAIVKRDLEPALASVDAWSECWEQKFNGLLPIVLFNPW